MKKVCCTITLYMLLVCLLFSGCKEPSVPNDTPATQGSTSSTNAQESTLSIKIDDSVWYSEEAGVYGRVWLGMTEKEWYDVNT